MPICEIDPWRTQYFESVNCPPTVFIPTEDSDAWTWNPRHRWVYDKLAVAASQGLPAAPHGVTPSTYPVFSKPIYNLKGMGIGSRALYSDVEYIDACQPGHMWMPLLTGEHISSDAALVDGMPKWWRHARGVAAEHGTFDFWEVRAEALPDLEESAGAWCQRHLSGYTGMVNLETIGGSIIEVHLRFSDQWPDLYGSGWVDALVGLYAAGLWKFDDSKRRTGYSVVLFMPHGARYTHPDATTVRAILTSPGISSVQITFHEDMPAERHAMPPGGFRVAIINCWDLQAGIRSRKQLRHHFARSNQLKVSTYEAREQTDNE